MILCMDANARHYMWGSTDINRRGVMLADYLIEKGLSCLNIGTQPTFVTALRQEVLDITVATQDLIRRIMKWHVLDKDSASDHRYIHFDIDYQTRPRTMERRDPRKTDWNKFRELLDMRACDFPTRYGTPTEIDAAVETVNNLLTTAWEDATEITRSTA